MKVVIADPKTGNCFQKEVEKTKEAQLVGKKVGEAFEGGIAGLPGYTLEITGGSDKDGFPMRPEITGSRRVSAFISSGAGMRRVRKGLRRRRTVVGNTVAASIVQVNAKIKEYGQKPLEELGFVAKPKEKKAEEKKEEKK
ncbi:30S ribosomal protein S6e [Candidatus Micrarchaeota archaeon]|nr:30S ribosomal protein S6e [Candidatus Micrarchaeota archaeon]